MRQTAWRKSSRSSDQADSACVEARAVAADFQVRDSKLGDSSPVFDLKTADFTGLLHSAARDLNTRKHIRGRTGDARPALFSIYRPRSPCRVLDRLLLSIPRFRIGLDLGSGSSRTRRHRDIAKPPPVARAHPRRVDPAARTNACRRGRGNLDGNTSGHL